MDTFGARLTQARKAAKLTQSALARAAHINSEASISKYEKDRLEPRLETTARLAEALGVSVDWLVGRDESARASASTRRRKAA